MIEVKGYIDMHCHILPEVDDGARDVEEMRLMLRTAYEDGIRCIIATPHHHPKRGNDVPESLVRQMKIVRQEAYVIDPYFRIYLGTEIFFGQDILEQIREKKILTMNRRNILLIEFSPSDSYGYIRQGLQRLQFGGYQIILAHVERYACIVDRPELAEDLTEMGILLQINAGSIVGENGRKIKKFVKRLMDEDLVFCVGTDAHDSIKRPPKMKKAAEYVEKKYGSEYQKKIFYYNAKKMLKRIEKYGTK